MRQVELTAPEKFEHREVQTPDVGAGQVKIAVKAVGVCGSDIHAYYGEHPFMGFPIVLGHECAGVVEETAPGVTNVKVGDRVVLRPQKVCGACKPCRDSRYNICQSLEVLGCQSAGGCSDHYVANGDLFYRLPDVIGFGEGTMIEPLAVAMHAVKRPFDDVKGKKVIVLGAGTIGNLVAQSAKGMGAKTVMITDVSDFKLDMARQCGVEHVVNATREDIGAAMREAFGPDGADAVYECTANEGALNQMLDAAPKGIPIVIVGVFAGMTNLNLANVQDREYTLMGTLMYVEKDYTESIRLVEEGKIDLKRLITKEFDLDHMEDAFLYIERHANEVQKVIVTI